MTEQSDCPICESEAYDWLKRVCPDCGHYDEYYAKRRHSGHKRGGL